MYKYSDFHHAAAMMLALCCLCAAVVDHALPAAVFAPQPSTFKAALPRFSLAAGVLAWCATSSGLEIHTSERVVDRSPAHLHACPIVIFRLASDLRCPTCRATLQVDALAG